MAHRKAVLGLYRKILQAAKRWETFSGLPSEARVEKEYIKEEAKILFKNNKNVTNEKEIKEFIREAESRLELALHYKNPYPRPVNIPQNTLPPGKFKMKKVQKRIISQSKPIYIKSYKDKT